MSAEAGSAHPAPAGTFFLAGTVQGARAGAELADQSYRAAPAARIAARRPGAVIHDPGALMRAWLAEHPGALAAHAALAATPTVHRAGLAPEPLALTAAFHRLTRLAAESEVCVAWLPGHEPSMGTAAEMLSAHRAGRTVVAVTAMRQNLAVLACATVIVPDLDAFDAWLAHPEDGG
ncbi:hypothetical protein [Streptomyces buecherae]|uniref:hypothetical protein n=1 Tax=Streptomyces buecherae TaxID=2763006 RepID=UPI003665A6EC